MVWQAATSIPCCKDTCIKWNARNGYVDEVAGLLKDYYRNLHKAFNMPEFVTSYYNSPLGTILIRHNEEFITEVGFLEENFPETQKPIGIAQQCMFQLDEYFTGKLRNFDLPLGPSGSDFQKKVWKTLQGIPYAATVSYLDIAKLLGDEKSTRAVGAANGKNPIGIIIPCHRVIGSDNTLTGYAGGLHRKKWLLQHEAKFGLGVQTLF